MTAADAVLVMVNVRFPPFLAPERFDARGDSRIRTVSMLIQMKKKGMNYSHDHNTSLRNPLTVCCLICNVRYSFDTCFQLSKINNFES